MLMLNQPVQLNDTSKLFAICAFDATTGKAKTGIDYTTVRVYTSLNGSADTSIGVLTNLEKEGTWTSLGFTESALVKGKYWIGMPNAQLNVDTGSLQISAQKFTDNTFTTLDDTVFFRPESVGIAGANLYVTDAVRDQAAAQEVLYTLAGHRGHVIEEVGGNITVTANDGTTNVVTQPRVRAGSALNPITKVG